MRPGARPEPIAQLKGGKKTLKEWQVRQEGMFSFIPSAVSGRHNSPLSSLSENRKKQRLRGAYRVPLRGFQTTASPEELFFLSSSKCPLTVGFLSIRVLFRAPAQRELRPSCPRYSVEAAQTELES